VFDKAHLSTSNISYRLRKALPIGPTCCFRNIMDEPALACHCSCSQLKMHWKFMTAPSRRAAESTAVGADWQSVISGTWRHHAAVLVQYSGMPLRNRAISDYFDAASCSYVLPRKERLRPTCNWVQIFNLYSGDLVY